MGVGGSSGRGVLTTCNYKARAFGCRSAMPVFQALRLCPQLVLVPGRYEVYRRESEAIRALFYELTPKVETLSLDEAYLDVSHHSAYAWDLAKALRKRIYERTRLTASAGIAPNKMLAKIASDWRKPNGQFAILPEDVEAFMRTLPLSKIPGIGPKTARRLQAAGLERCGQLHDLDFAQLQALLGPRWAASILKRARGEDDTPVEPQWIRKSLSTERTFAEDLPDLEACLAQLPELVDELASDLVRREPERAFTKAFVKVKFHDFQVTTREAAATTLDLDHFRQLLCEAYERGARAVRLLGVGVRFPEPASTDARQLELPVDRPAAAR